MINKINFHINYVNDWQYCYHLGYLNYLTNRIVTEIDLNISFSPSINLKNKLLIPLLGLELLTCQKAKITKIKKSIANFDVKENMEIGCKINLHSLKKNLFFFKLFSLFLPNYKNLYKLLELLNKNKEKKIITIGLSEIINFMEFTDIYLYVHLLKGMDIILKKNFFVNAKK